MLYKVKATWRDEDINLFIGCEDEAVHTVLALQDNGIKSLIEGTVDHPIKRNTYQQRLVEEMLAFVNYDYVDDPVLH